jgi:hypothetical protein
MDKVQAAAAEGNAYAQYIVGMRHVMGNGIHYARNYQQAYFWLLLSSAGGEELAIEVIERIEIRLTSQQCKAARADARNWRPGNP